MAECVEHISVPTLPNDDCNGCMKNASCVVVTEAITLLDLPANSTLDDVLSAFVLAINSLIIRVEDLESRVDILEV